ncbi:MAG TPA: helical backbone metal receptor [Terriglobia bacterium]|jgi:iron complex transport system substrate-binding protein
MLWLMLFLALAPHRIVSVAPSITEILFALGAGDQVVGDTTYCNYPEAAKLKPKIGGYTTPDLEAILARRPDLVFMMKSRPDIAQKLRGTGIDVVELQPETLAGIFEEIQTVAAKIGVPEKGRDLVQSIDKEIHSGAVRPGARKPTVVFVVGRTPGTVADLVVVGHVSFLNELIEFAGGTNVFSDAVISYPHVGMEDIIHRDPDVIIDMGHNEMISESQKADVRQIWQKYNFLRAVKRGAVFPVSADYFVTPGPRVGQAVLDIRKLIGN